MAVTRGGNKRYLGFNVPAETYDRLVAIAEADKRTLASLMQVVISQWLAQHDNSADRSRGPIPPKSFEPQIRIRAERGDHRVADFETRVSDSGSEEEEKK